MVNLKTVARIAKVNPTTVSRYFNSPDVVSPQTAAKIAAAVKKTGYIPKSKKEHQPTADNGIKSQRIVWIIGNHNPLTAYLGNPMLADFLESITLEFQKCNTAVETAFLDSNDSLPAYITPDYCDGVILLDDANDSKIQSMLHTRLERIPTVRTLFYQSYFPSIFDTVCFDNQTVAHLAAVFFMEHNVKHVSLIMDDFAPAILNERKQFFVSECAMLGIKCHILNPQVQVKCEPSPPDFHWYESIANQHLELTEKGCDDAFFFLTGLELLGISKVMSEKGVSPVNAKHLVCSSSTEILKLFRFPPAAINLKMTQIGFLTAQRLLERIRLENMMKTSQIIVTPELIDPKSS